MSYDTVVLPTFAPVAPLGGAAPVLPPLPPPMVPPSLGGDQLLTSSNATSTYFPATPQAPAGYPPYPYGYPAPYAGPDVFDGMRDVTHGVVNGIGRVGTEVGQALPVVGEHVWNGTQVVGRKVFEGGKTAAGFLPAIGRSLWGAVSWVGDKVADVGRFVWGGADSVHDRLKLEYGRLPPGYYPYPLPMTPPGYGMPWPAAVVVERGDTLRSISQQFLGDGERWRELYALNEAQIKAVGGLRTGMVLQMPSPFGSVPTPAPTPVPSPAPQPTPKPKPKPAPAEPKPTPKPVGSHTVKQGETLWALAHRYYGDATRWREIFEANKAKIQDPALIYPGQTLRIPR